MITPISPLKATRFAVAVLVASASLGLSLHAQTTNSTDASASNPALGMLLSNPDFSLATKSPTWPDDWNKAAGISWETEDGKHFLRLKAQAPDKMLMAYREMEIPAGVTSLQITIRYRTSGVVPGAQNYMDARAIFHFLDGTRKALPPDPHVLDFSNGEGVWTEATETCTVPAGAAKLVLMPSLYHVQDGTLDLAEVSVTPAP